MNSFKYTSLCLIILIFSSCDKDWLDIKQNKKQVVPKTLADFQAMLDDTNTLNFGVYPIFGHISSDDYFLTPERWSGLTNLVDKNTYVWAKDILGHEQSTDWNVLYRMVLYANSASFGIENIELKEDERAIWNNIQGSALFHRSWAFYQLAQLFCKQYDPATAAVDQGIPLRLNADINHISSRATIQMTYLQIIKDLENATPLLPVTPLVKTRPSKPAALALLAKVHLQMGNYQQAMQSAESSLALYSTLIDYQKLNPKENFPIEQFNTEVLFHSSTSAPTILIPSRLNVDSLLYRSYADNDLRQKLFFYPEGVDFKFKGSYDGSRVFFGGIATDEVYLINAESAARLGEMQKALTSLNKLLINRYHPFVSIKESNPAKLLSLILDERRKELVFRGTRWSDLKRLNKEPVFATVLTRKVGMVIKLPPNSLNYVMPIPKTVIELTGMEQNLRE